MSSLPPLPGAIGVTHLRVYDSPAIDGVRGGTPHVHSCCTEGYYVLGGSGSVQTISMGGGVQTMGLEQGVLVWFTPGTIHRLINSSGNLEILVLMANDGLPEAGDMVLTFPDEILADSNRYWSEALLSDAEATTDGSGAEARVRRDLAVTGFVDMRDAWLRGDRTAVAEFLHRVVELLGPRAAGWRGLWEAGPLAAVERTREQLDGLSNGAVFGLLAGGAHRLQPPVPPRRMGCCGTLGTYVLPER